VGAVGPGRVRLVGKHRVGSGPWPAAAGSGDPQVGQHSEELGAAATLTGGDQHGDQFAALFAGQIGFGGPAAPRPAEPVIGRLDLHATGRLFLRLAVSAGSGRVLVGAADGRVDADRPQSISPALSARACNEARI
jgi:hypothetical protein